MKNWKNRKVLITGANGFVGLNLTKALLKLQAKIVTLSHSGLSHGRILLSEQEINQIEKKVTGSITDYKFLERIVKKNHITTIFHLAAQPLVEIGRESPLNTFEVNIRGTWNILEVARVHNIEKIVIASSTHVYGDNPNLPYREDYFPQPSRPYETSKACADLLAQSFADTYNLPVEITRFVNLYGPGDLNFSRLIPKTMKAAITGENPQVWDVGAVRDFLFIDDAVQAYVMLAQQALPSGKRVRMFNFGSGNPQKIIDITEKILKISGNKNISVQTREIPEEREKEIQRQYISIEKARKILHWEPKISLESGLERSYLWYKDYFRKTENI